MLTPGAEPWHNDDPRAEIGSLMPDEPSTVLYVPIPRYAPSYAGQLSADCSHRTSSGHVPRTSPPGKAACDRRTAS